MSNVTLGLRFEDCSRGEGGSLPGFYIVSGDGFSYRCYGWAANLKLAKRAMTKLRRDLRTDPYAKVETTARAWK